MSSPLITVSFVIVVYLYLCCHSITVSQYPLPLSGQGQVVVFERDLSDFACGIIDAEIVL